jgi:hypothetical protein
MFAIDGRRPERFQVRSDELAIKQGEMPDLEPSHQPGKRDL